MSKYRFIFSVGDKPDLQGHVDFPEGEVLHFPQTNNEVRCASNYGQEIRGVVQDISFHYDLEKSGSEPGDHMTEFDSRFLSPDADDSKILIRLS